MSRNDLFDREFGHRARGLRRTPSTRSWDQLEARLDRRRRGTRILGIRPWMVAALFLLAAGVAIISDLTPRQADVLAQRAEFMEELTTPFVPSEPFTPEFHLDGTPIGSEAEVDPDFREVPVADKYRVRG